MSNPRRSNGHRRDQVVRRVKAEETHCFRCGNPVDLTLPHGLPESPEVDEIIAVSKGGSPYDRDNCRLSHRLCNQRHGNGDRKAKPKPIAQPLRTTRKWV